MGIFNIMLIITGSFIIIFMIKRLSLPKILLSILSGMAALFMCDLIFSFYGSYMPINLYTLSISALGSIPGVILLTLLKTFFFNLP